jgi:mono/diheme cytochrome c family protein
METDQFCGQSCHVMKPQFTANRRTVHRNVGCVECHIVPGAAGFAQAKLNGTRQLIEVTLHDYPRPIPPGLQSSHMASSAETCEKCHSRAVDIGSPLRIISKFKDDEANTPIQTVLLMNGSRIHGAHLGPGVVIQYHADAKRQTISSVDYSNTRTHETRTYTAAGPGGAQEFVMQCADCHNRQGHAFEQPEEAVDRAMAAGQISTAIPFAHKTAVEALKNGNPPTDKTLLAIYQRNVFPEFGVKWGTYPNNLGHDGCFRCHDESHATPQKKTITQDCSTCHNPLAVEETSPPILKSLGLAK